MWGWRLAARCEDEVACGNARWCRVLSYEVTQKADRDVDFGLGVERSGESCLR